MLSPDTFEIFSSGFVGGRITTGKKKTVNVREGVAKLLTIVIPEKNELVYSDQIEELFSRWVKHEVLHLQRADVELAFFEEAFELFSNVNFFDWLLLQERSPSFTKNHRDFLNDTMKFILTGKRNISVVNWDAIFHLTVPVSSSLSLMVDQDLQKQLRSQTDGRFSNVFIRWLGQEGGVTDFFHSIRLMYGKQLAI